MSWSVCWVFGRRSLVGRRRVRVELLSGCLLLGIGCRFESMRERAAKWCEDWRFGMCFLLEKIAVMAGPWCGYLMSCSYCCSFEGTQNGRCRVVRVGETDTAGCSLRCSGFSGCSNPWRTLKMLPGSTSDHHVEYSAGSLAETFGAASVVPFEGLFVVE